MSQMCYYMLIRAATAPDEQQPPNGARGTTATLTMNVLRTVIRWLTTPDNELAALLIIAFFGGLILIFLPWLLIPILGQIP